MLHSLRFFFLIRPRPPTSTLFPYTTLFRSLSFCVLLQYLVERRRVVTQLGKLDYDATPFNQILDRKSGSAGMPRPISYAVFCLKKKKSQHTWHRARRLDDGLSSRLALCATI